jgi:hypothetical protein
MAKSDHVNTMIKREQSSQRNRVSNSPTKDAFSDLVRCHLQSLSGKSHKLSKGLDMAKRRGEKGEMESVEL